MSYFMNKFFLASLNIASLALAEPCEEEDLDYVWHEETKTCMSEFEFQCRTLKRTFKNSAKLETISTLLYILDEYDCPVAAKALQKRTTLEIHNSQIRDLSALKGLWKLKYLNLNGTSVNDESLMNLTTLPNLEGLALNSTGVVNPDSIAYLVKTHPKLRKIWIRGIPIPSLKGVLEIRRR